MPFRRTGPRRSSLGRRLLHPFRLLGVALLVALIPRGPSPDAFSGPTGISPPPSDAFPQFPPGAIVSPTMAGDRWPIIAQAPPPPEHASQDDPAIGYVIRTLPAAHGAVGYRGVTEAAIRTDTKGRVVEVAILQSDDTREHVRAVAEDQRFFDQFVGRKWPDEMPDRVDGVSGATLTSLAMAEGIRRAAGAKASASAVFPDPLNPSESVRSDPQITVIRTGPLVDTIAGYQGPTELLIDVDASDRWVDAKVRRSYDNDPYVGYLEPDTWFWGHFLGKTHAEIATIDIEAAGIEGVSGATMTSLAVAQTAVESAQQIIQRRNRQQLARENTRWRSILRRIPIADYAAALMMVILALGKSRGWFRGRVARKLWLTATVMVVGFWSGNLISLTLLSGWATVGIAWRLAPVLAAFVVISFVVPAITKSNPYCNHLCPHGAAQQYVLPGKKRRIKLPRRVTESLGWLPGGLLTLAYIAMIFRAGWDYSDWEPFHAYRLGLASTVPIGLAIASLVVSIWLPMAYCRWGCPTGRLIDYLRRRGIGDRFQIADAVMCGLILLAAWNRYG